MREIGFHRIVRQWFETAFPGPTRVQLEGWRAIAGGRDTLIAAPTGSGKTLAAFLWAVDSLFKKADTDELEDRIHVVYVSPLKALGNDIEKNLRAPLAAIDDLARSAGREPTQIRVGVRTGDTPSYERQLQIRRLFGRHIAIGIVGEGCPVRPRRQGVGSGPALTIRI